MEPGSRPGDVIKRPGAYNNQEIGDQKITRFILQTEVLMDISAMK